MSKSPYVILCPLCHAPIELRHVPGKPTVEAVPGPKPELPDTEPPDTEPPDDDVSAIHALIDEGGPD